MRYQELFPALGFERECILTALFSMSLASPMYFWMSLLSQTSRVGLARPSSMCRRKDVRRSSPGETGLPWAPLPGQLQPRVVATTHPSLMVALWWRCRENFRGAEESLPLPSGQSAQGPGASWGEMGLPCWCVLRRYISVLVLGFLALLQAGSRAGDSPPCQCQEQCWPSRALWGILPAASHSRCQLLTAALAKGSAAGTAFPSAASTLLTRASLRGCARCLPFLAAGISSLKALCASTCLAAHLGTAPVPKSPWRSLFPYDRHGEMLGCR